MQNERIKKIKWARRKPALVVVACSSLVVASLSVIFYSMISNQSHNATELQKSRDTLTINRNLIKIERAQTESERAKGLCCRDYLAPDAGMLFIFDQPGKYRFWMKNTRIPLDMYWISSEKKIVHIEKNVQPSSYPSSFGTDTPAQYVLETNAGFAEEHGITVGDPVRF